MPLRRSSSPPPAMTWAKAAPVITVAGIFDFIRIIFEQFWFFGPAITAALCTAKVSGTLSSFTFGVLGTKTAAAGCTAIAGTVGFFGFGPIAAFGLIMAMAFGFLGFLILFFWILTTNTRLFQIHRTSMLWLTSSLGIAELPFAGTFPIFSTTLFFLYRKQIRTERKALVQWKKEQGALLQQERNRRTAESLKILSAGQAQAANDNEAENGEIPEEARRAA